MHLNGKKIACQLLGHLRDLVIVVLIGNTISFAFSLEFVDFWERLKINSLYSLFIGATLWKGNQLVGHVLAQKIDINTNPSRALLWNLSAMFAFSLVAILVVNYIWFVEIYDWTVEQMFKRGMLTMLIEFFVTAAITSIFFSIGFFRAWRESAVNEERLQKESIKFQYEALKNQINPHFLFNSLNSLTSLVYQDQDQAATFIKQLSEVFRYVLMHKDNELVALEEEIEFSKRYVYLQKIRHNDNLQVNFSIEKKPRQYIVPVSIQILIENAIKHNEASEDNPLIVDVTNTDDKVIVQNKLQPKTAIKDSGGVGLSTIRARYSYLSDKQVVTSEQNGSYTVEIPIINNPDS